MTKILIAGESWTSHTIHIKGFDTFTTSKYEEGVKWFKEGLEKNGVEVDYIPNHLAPEKFPVTLEELKKYGLTGTKGENETTVTVNGKTYMIDDEGNLTSKNATDAQ